MLALYIIGGLIITYIVFSIISFIYAFVFCENSDDMFLSFIVFPFIPIVLVINLPIHIYNWAKDRINKK